MMGNRQDRRASSLPTGSGKSDECQLERLPEQLTDQSTKKNHEQPNYEGDKE